MMDERDLRQLHGRLVGVLSYAKSCGVPFRALRELIAAKVQLEWVLDMQTASARDWQAATIKAIVNLEGLKLTAERSRQAGEN